MIFVIDIKRIIIRNTTRSIQFTILSLTISISKRPKNVLKSIYSYVTFIQSTYLHFSKKDSHYARIPKQSYSIIKIYIPKGN